MRYIDIEILADRYENEQLVSNEINNDYMNNNFMNDPNEFTTDNLSEDSLINQYFDAIHTHDYSYMFSDDNRSWLAGTKSEKHIKELIHSLISICRVDAEQLYEDSLSEVTEQYVDGLCHRIIKGWFNDYLPKYYSKDFFKCVDGMYYVADEFDVDGDGWVNEEQLELLLHEFNNGVK